MPILPIPLTRGQHEEADAKVLPNGLLTVAQNVRFRKDGRLGLRFGYDSVNGATFGADCIADAQFDVKHNIMITRRKGTSTPSKPQRYAYGSLNDATSPTSSAPSYTEGGSLGAPERIRSGSGQVAIGNGIGSCDAVVSGNFLYVVVAAYTLGSTTGNILYNTCVYDVFTGAMILSNNALIEANASNVKLLIINNLLCIFWAIDSTNLIRMAAYSLSFLGTVLAPTTVVTATAGQARSFDVADGIDSTHGYLTYQSGANTLNFGEVTSAAVYASLNTIATTNTFVRPSIVKTFNAPTDQVAIVWLDGASLITGNAKYTVYRRSTTSFIIGTTSVDTSNRCTGYPVISQDPTNDWSAAFNVGADTSFQTQLGVFQSGGAVTYEPGQAVVCKPFTATGGGGSGVFVLTTDRDASTFAPIDRGSYFAYAMKKASGSTLLSCECLFGQEAAKPADSASAVSDPRRRVAAVSVTGNEPGIAAIMMVLPVQSDREAGWDLFRIEYGDREEQLLPASLNQQLVLSGGRILEYDGQSVYESGFAARPFILSVAVTAGAAIAAGTYSYIAVWEWFDYAGRRHLSPPSLPVSITIGVAANLRVLIDAPHATNKTTARLRTYRTVSNGITYYDITDVASTINAAGLWSVVVDATADATLVTHEILYTQGQRGGLSGLHERLAPPPARYIAAGKDRLLIGGLETTTQVQWSMLVFPGEPMAWARDAQWTANIPERVTGVAELDGIWYVGSLDGIWSITGEGPDDNGSGSFSVPQQLPADVGFKSHKSILKTGQGLMFQSVRGIELLPRGAGAPEWVGQPVRDTIALFPYCGVATFNAVEQVCYWAMVDATATAGRLIVFDTRIGEWYVDDFYQRAIKTLSVYDGKLVIDGSFFETAAYTDDDTGAKTTFIPPTITTGDIMLFGAGWGQAIKVQLLAEARDVTASWTLQLEVSYDSGKTFAEIATWTRATLATAVGDAIDAAEHYFVQQRVKSLRLRWSVTCATPTEGVVFNQMDFEIVPQGGLKRLPNSVRAA